MTESLDQIIKNVFLGQTGRDVLTTLTRRALAAELAAVRDAVATVRDEIAEQFEKSQQEIDRLALERDAIRAEHSALAAEAMATAERTGAHFRMDDSAANAAASRVAEEQRHAGEIADQLDRLDAALAALDAAPAPADLAGLVRDGLKRQELRRPVADARRARVW